MLTVRDLINDPSDTDAGKLSAISDKLWKLGCLTDIKEKVSPDLFALHVGMNLIGNWKADGWWYILCEQADLVPYIPTTLEKLNLPELKTAFENVIVLFPEFTVFQSDNNTYCDIVNFLQNTRFKVQDERLNSIAPEKRKEMVVQVSQKLDLLEDLTKPLFGEDSACNGWKPILDFISANVPRSKYKSE